MSSDVNITTRHGVDVGYAFLVALRNTIDNAEAQGLVPASAKDVERFMCTTFQHVMVSTLPPLKAELSTQKPTPEEPDITLTMAPREALRLKDAITVARKMLWGVEQNYCTTGYVKEYNILAEFHTKLSS